MREIHPGATEVANAIDDDCNDVVDDGVSAACPWTVEEPDGGCEVGLELVVGRAHACVLTDAGRVLCWGKNDAGVLGTPDIVNSSVPVAVPGVDGATALVASLRTTCAVVGDDAICWGAGLSYPFTVPLPAGTTQVALNFVDDANGWQHYIYALDDAGQVWSRSLFLKGAVNLEFAMGAAGLKQLLSGGPRLCAISDTDALLCAIQGVMSEVAPGPVDWAVQAHDGQVCYKRADALYCTAANGMGATEIAGNASAVGVAVSSAFACAFNEAGKLACWDNGPNTIADAASVAVNDSFGCVLHQAGHASCWGDGDGGMLGDTVVRPHKSAEPVAVAAGPMLELTGPILLSASPLGACDSLGDVSRFLFETSNVHDALAGCSAQCENTLDAAACFADCAVSPGLSAACFDCYVGLAACTGPDCYAAFNACAGFPVDFARAISNSPRFECAGAGCMHGESLGQPCEKNGDCYSGMCSTLPQSSESRVCTAADGSSCYRNSAYCACELGSVRVTNSGHCGGCYALGRVESGEGDCFRECTSESFCMANQQCRYFSSGNQRYCE